MIVSEAHRYVYIGIPRTGSKSIHKWLGDHFEGHWHGGHHDWRVPEECRDYLVFTVIRNPYEIQASGWFFGPVIKPNQHPTPSRKLDIEDPWVRLNAPMANPSALPPAARSNRLHGAPGLRDYASYNAKR